MVTAAGVVVVIMAVVVIVASGDARQSLGATVTALPVGILLALAGCDLLSRSTCPALGRWPTASFDEWLRTAQSRHYAAKAAFN